MLMLLALALHHDPGADQGDRGEREPLNGIVEMRPFIERRKVAPRWMRKVGRVRRGNEEVWCHGIRKPRFQLSSRDVADDPRGRAAGDRRIAGIPLGEAT